MTIMRMMFYEYQNYNGMLSKWTDAIYLILKFVILINKNQKKHDMAKYIENVSDRRLSVYK